MNETTTTKPKKTNVAGGAASRRGRSRTTANAAVKVEKDDSKPAAKRRTSSRRAAVKKEDDVEETKATKKKGAAKIKKEPTAASKKEVTKVKKEDSTTTAPIPRKKRSFVVKKEVVKKESSTAAAAVVKKESKKKKGGVKRSSSDSSSDGSNNNTTTTTTTITAPSTKRVKKESIPTAIVTAPRTTRSRSRSGSSSSRRGGSKSSKKKPMRPVVVDIIPATDNRIIPHDFGLKRESFNGENFTYGIAHYDADQRDNSLLCKGYVTDIFQQLYRAEVRLYSRCYHACGPFRKLASSFLTCISLQSNTQTNYRTEPYMDDQEDVNEKMRAILIDWLVDVHLKFRLVPETLHLCVHIIDRYCSLADVSRIKLQLVGVTALLLACKHEEIYPPEVRDCVYITDRAYDRQEVLDMEQSILRVLEWKISLPTAFPFLDRFLSLTKASPMTRHAATYYMERTLQEHDMLVFRPSMVVAASVILALNNPAIRLNEEDYDRELPGLSKVLMEYTEFDEAKLYDCMFLVAEKVSAPVETASRRQLVAVKRKYESRKYLQVSFLENPDVKHVRQAQRRRNR